MTTYMEQHNNVSWKITTDGKRVFFSICKSDGTELLNGNMPASYANDLANEFHKVAKLVNYQSKIDNE